MRYYVSLTKDLLGCFLEFEADQAETVRLYLTNEYYRDGWKLPWCSIYTEQKFKEQTNKPGTITQVIRARCGVLVLELEYARSKERRAS